MERCRRSEAKRRSRHRAALAGDGPARARDLHSALSGIFAWLQRNRRIEQSPLAGLHRPATPKARERVLSADEIRLFWSACRDIGEPFGTIFRLLLLTGQRLTRGRGRAPATSSMAKFGKSPAAGQRTAGRTSCRFLRWRKS